MGDVSLSTVGSAPGCHSVDQGSILRYFSIPNSGTGDA